MQQNNEEREKLISKQVDQRCKQIEEKYDKKLEMMSSNIDILEKKLILWHKNCTSVKPKLQTKNKAWQKYRRLQSRH